MRKYKKHTKESVLEDALKYKTKMEWYRASPGAKDFAQDNGLIEEATTHMSGKIRWSIDKVKDISKKYNRLVDWQRDCPGSYEFALRNSLINLCSIHMLTRNWTAEEVQKDALKYDSRREWKNNSSAYEFARKNGLLENNTCSHMTKRRSHLEKQLLEFIKKSYPSAKCVRFSTKGHNLTLSNLEIDIFIPELNKGIEFDGTYWHGKGFKRKGFSSVEDYHRVKDSFFQSKDIDILHITELDWVQNKEECLKKSISFLEV